MANGDETLGAEELVELIKARRAELRLSLRGLEARTLNPETGKPVIGFKWLHKLENGALAGVPGEAELRALAKALELPYGTIADAAASQYFGVQRVYSEDGEVRAMVQRVERMSPEEVSRLRQLMDLAFPKKPE